MLDLELEDDSGNHKPGGPLALTKMRLHSNMTVIRDVNILVLTLSDQLYRIFLLTIFMKVLFNLFKLAKNAECMEISLCQLYIFYKICA